MLVSTDLIDICPTKITFSKEEKERLESVFEQLQENWLDVIYGDAGLLRNEEWFKMVTSPEGMYIFDAAKLRNQIFDEAGVPKRYL